LYFGVVGFYIFVLPFSVVFFFFFFSLIISFIDWRELNLLRPTSPCILFLPRKKNHISSSKADN